MTRDGVGFFIAVEPRKDNGRSNLGFHPNGLTPGSHGCPALDADGKTVKEFRSAFDKYNKEGGSLPVEVRSASSASGRGRDRKR